MLTSKTTNITWNVNGEMVLDDKSVPGTYITVHVNDILRKARHEIDPVGIKALIEQLRTTEVPRGIVGNSDVARKLAPTTRKHIP